MLPIESSTILRIVIFSAFVGFVLFCASYATHVWLKRNKGNRSGASRVFKVGLLLALIGLLGVGASWAVNRFVDRSGIVDGGALFVVHARRGGHVVMAPGELVGKNEVIAEYQPPGFADDLKVIDSQIDEVQARIDTLRVRPLELDPVLLQRQEQLRGQIGQQRQFQVEFARARRELDRVRLDSAIQSERERSQTINEFAAVRTAIDGVQQQLNAASQRLARAIGLRKQGLVTIQVLDERAAAALALRLEGRRLDTATAGLAARLSMIDQQRERAVAAYDEQRSDLRRREADAAQNLATLDATQEELAGHLAQDRVRAATRRVREIEVAQRQVATLIAERNKAVAAQQITAPFAGRVVYRNASPGLAGDGAPILAVSTGMGFVANIAMPAAEIDSITTAGAVTFALENPILNRKFPGQFRAVEPVSSEPGRIVAIFDAQLPQEAIGLLGAGREAVKVRLLWQPPLLESGQLRASLLVVGAGLLLLLFDRLRGSFRLPRGLHQEGNA